MFGNSVLAFLNPCEVQSFYTLVGAPGIAPLHTYLTKVGNCYREINKSRFSRSQVAFSVCKTRISTPPYTSRAFRKSQVATCPCPLLATCDLRPATCFHPRPLLATYEKRDLFDDFSRPPTYSGGRKIK
jgi:hypothetical protein